MLIAAPRFVFALWQLLAMIPLKGSICAISVGCCIVAEMELQLSMSKSGPIGKPGTSDL